MYKKQCELCKKKYQASYNHQKTCSEPCRKERAARMYGRYAGVGQELPTGTVGAISELVVSADLMKHGYDVFRALSPSCYCDLLASDKEGFIKKIEVKTGYKSQQTGKISKPKADPSKYDILAVYERNEGKVYYFCNEGFELEHDGDTAFDYKNSK